MVHTRAKSVDLTGMVRAPIRSMNRDQVDGPSEERPLQPTGLPGDQEDAEQTRANPQKTADGDGGDAELSLISLYMHEDQADSEIDFWTSSSTGNLRRSASCPLLDSPPRPLSPTSLREFHNLKFLVRLRRINRQVRATHTSYLVTYHLCRLPSTFEIHHDTPSIRPESIPFDTPFNMYHFPTNPALYAQYHQHMADYHSRPLQRLLDPSECPIGSEADLRARPYNAVVLIENIPYTVTRQEVVQFFGRDANLAPGWPVHIIMERSTGKTMACYVEFAHPVDAQRAVDRIKQKHDSNQGPRMGNRYVDVVVSSQNALMKALFPRANCIDWVSGRPVQVPPPADDEGAPGFTGFLTAEELFCVARHAREPNRSAYATKVPQRTYESIISTVWKFPWYVKHMYTVHARNKLFYTLKSMIEVLVERLEATQTMGLDGRLVTELLRAGLECPAFNPRMKFVLAEASEDQGILRRMHMQWLQLFPFDTLTWLPPNNPIKLEFYAGLIARGQPDRIPEGMKRLCFEDDVPKLFGNFWFEWLSEPAANKLFSVAAAEEKQLLRSLLTSGFAAVHGTTPGPSNPPCWSDLDPFLAFGPRPRPGDPYSRPASRPSPCVWHWPSPSPGSSRYSSLPWPLRPWQLAWWLLLWRWPPRAVGPPTGRRRPGMLRHHLSLMINEKDPILWDLVEDDLAADMAMM
ncbi:uncharacterized protein N7496_007724 [Penicillium cataractarum]|uniref:RRM domain-containing protein n=1 Tax=Penicillium cataractarum TaxID=2100454 RepID=A0A9W9RZ08_9EURO|nr:uncharacterized protein N7496_007724 [Penicillium cataractarum]KAJ5367964.1 hypothetical protein N7496_007724 [Penicillium cataractarum]